MAWPDPPRSAGLVLAIAILQVITELFVARNYGIAVVAITPMALILTHLGAPEPLDRLVLDRVVETLLGAAATLLVIALAHALGRSRKSISRTYSAD
jgi:hypothetical protein